MSSAQTKIEAFFKQYPTSTYPKNQVLMAAGQPSHFFYVIESGAVKMTTLSTEGRSLVLHIFFPQAFFSLLTLVNQSVNEYDFVTLTSTTVRKVPQAELIAFLQANNDVLFELQLRLLRGMSGLLNRIEKSAFTPAYLQVANLLLYYARHFSPEGQTFDAQQKTIHVHITHQDIADWLGLSRENVSIQMKQLEREKLIRKNEKFVEILNAPKLEELVNPFAVI